MTDNSMEKSRFCVEKQNKNARFSSYFDRAELQLPNGDCPLEQSGPLITVGES